VTSSFIGANWGADVTEKAFIALIVFLVVVSLLMALYFRTLKMSVAALVALFHDVVITLGIYALVGFEITPAAVIGFLTILGYSLYDTVVVFDKVRENTLDVEFSETTTFASQVNLAINQTLVRSVNTSVVAVLPVAAILFVGATALGAGTLRDISLALFIGIIAGTYSSVFLAGPLYVDLRARESRFKDKTASAKL
jgi:preprotein translocase subunit SecF